MAGNNILVYDAEIFSNLFMVCCYEPESDSYRDFRYTGAGNDTGELKSFLEQAQTLISFNGLGFDNILLQHFWKTGDVESTKALANAIIDRSIYRKPVRLGAGDEIDICMVLDRKAGLKAFQARLQLERICEWEGDFTKPIPDEEIPALIEYCHYDCRSTWLLYRESHVQGKIAVKRALGTKYSVEWNNTESSLAEEILEKEIKAKLSLPERSRVKDIRKPQTKATGKELLSRKIKFRREYLSTVLKATKDFVFEYIQKSGKNFLAKAFAQRLEIPKPDGSIFACNLGVGGLHSVEIHAAVVEPKDGQLINYDVSSYYPSTIDLLSIAPAGIEEAFLGSYRPVITERLSAKARGEKTAANSLKIVLNATFGRLKYPGSCLYNPASFLAVTLNCQFFYLMLIEQFLLAGIEILQVNTDGILVYPKGEQIQTCEKIVQWWQKLTGYKLDNEQLDGILIKDSNNYAWIKGGKIVKEKGKGFRSGGKRLDVDCGFPLVSGLAVQEYFLRGTTTAETVQAAFGRQEWPLFALWGSRKEKAETFPDDESTEQAEGKRRLRRYVYTKAPVDKIQGVAGNVALLEDASKIDWNNIDAEKYITEANAIILACTEGKEAAEAHKKEQAKKGKPQGKRRSKGQVVETPLFDFAEAEERPEPFAGVPVELRNIPQWVLWKLEPVADRPKPAKVPYTVAGSKASTTNPEHWSTFEKCFDVWQTGGYSGLGFVFAGNGIAGIDLDGVIDSSGQVQPEAKKWVDQFCSYTEISQSGRGLHILVKGKIPGERHRVGNIELYETDRYFAITGRALNGQREIRACQAELDNFYQAVFTESEAQAEPETEPASPEMPDEKIISKASKAKNAAKFTALYTAGDIAAYAGDESGADFALCSLLAFYTQNPVQIDRIYRQSALYKRPGRAAKWDSQRGSDTYGERTIRKAIEKSGEVYQPKPKSKKPQGKVIGLVEMRRRIEEIRLEKPYHEDAWESLTLGEYEERIRALEPGKILLTSGATGAGKTHRGLKALVEKGMPATIWSPTIHAANRAIGILKRFISQEDVGLIIAANTASDESGPGDDIETVSAGARCAFQLLSTTFGYLGRKGNKGQSFSVAKQLIENRIHLVDEPQKLWDTMAISYKLAKRFWAHGETCEGIGTCLLSSKRGDCASCLLGYRLKPPAGRGQARKFYREFPNEPGSLSLQTQRRDLGILRWDEIDDIESYNHLAGTTFYKLLQDVSKYEIPDDAGSSEVEYLTHLFKTLKWPQLRRQHPATKAGLPAEYPEAQLIPQYPCEPILMGVDFLPMLQLFQGQSIIFTSATMPQEFISLVEEIAQVTGKQVERLAIKDRPAKFKMALLKLPEAGRDPDTANHNLSLESQSKVIAELDRRQREANTPVRSFVVTAKRSEAIALYGLAKQSLPEHSKLFDQRDYEAMAELSAEEINTGDHLYSYGRGALGVNVDMPDRQLIMVSAKQFLPMMAILVKPGMTEEQARLEIAKNAWGQIDQIVGRLLRVKRELLKPGEVIHDPRQIVVVLHSLPDVLAGYRPNQEALYEYREYSPEKDGFLPATGASIADAVADAIQACLAGQAPPNRRKADLEKLQAKAQRQKSVGIGALSKAQRKATGQSRERAKEAKALAKWQEKVTGAKKLLLEDELSEKQVNDKLHLRRLSKSDFKKFWQDVLSD